MIHTILCLSYKLMHRVFCDCFPVSNVVTLFILETEHTKIICEKNVAASQGRSTKPNWHQRQWHMQGKKCISYVPIIWKNHNRVDQSTKLCSVFPIVISEIRANLFSILKMGFLKNIKCGERSLSKLGGESHQIDNGGVLLYKTQAYPICVTHLHTQHHLYPGYDAMSQERGIVQHSLLQLNRHLPGVWAAAISGTFIVEVIFFLH